MTTTIPTSTSVEGRLGADPHLQHAADGRAFVRVLLHAQPTPRYQADGSFAEDPGIECTLLVFGKAAQCLARRFRYGDVVVVSGRVWEKDPGTFVARRVGHDAARTNYTVTRTVAKRAERTRRRRAAAPPDNTPPPVGSDARSRGPIVAEPILPGRPVRTA